MATLGLLHASIAAQIQAASQERRYLEPICVAHDLAAFRAQLPEARPDVLIVDLHLLGDTPSEEIERLMLLGASELCLVVYDFARRRDLEALATREHIKVLRAPVSLSMLRSSMLGVISREIFNPVSLPQALPDSAENNRAEIPLLPIGVRQQLRVQLGLMGPPLIRAISDLETLRGAGAKIGSPTASSMVKLTEAASEAYRSLSRHAHDLYKREFQRR